MRSVPPLKTVTVGAALAVLLAVPGTVVTAVAFTEARLSLELEPGQAAVLTGAPDEPATILSRAGHHRVAGPLTEAHVVDLRPRRIVFGAGADDASDDADADRREALEVRTRNGSVLQMQQLEVHWRVNRDRALVALGDSGGGDPLQNDRVAALAAVAMRDAYGVLESEEVADALRARDALDLARADLAGRLERHGLELIQVVAPKPRFDREYEVAIEQRKVFEQEAERLSDERESFPTQRETLFETTEAKLQLTVAMQEEELAVLEGQQREAIAKVLDDAQRHATAVRLEAQARRAELGALAQQKLSEGQASAGSLGTTIATYAEHGDVAVREALVDRLATVRFEIAPREVQEENL